MNSLNLNIKEVIYKDAHNDSILSKDIKMQPSEETVSIIFQNNLPLGDSGHLKIIFSGNIQDNMKGFYRSKNIRYNIFNELQNHVDKINLYF